MGAQRIRKVATRDEMDEMVDALIANSGGERVLVKVVAPRADDDDDDE